MNQTLQERVDAARDAAADWLVRLERPTAGETDWIEFNAWLDAAPEHQQAYDAVLNLWSDFDAEAPELVRALDEREARNTPPPRHGISRRWTIVGGLAAAGLLVAVVPWADLTAPTTVYTTAKGERRVVTLADGTRIDMNAGSRLTVKLGASSRRVTMDDAEAVFDVAKDAERPFLITAGDRIVRVVGTQFNVRRRDGVQSVTVRRGIVEVSPSKGATGHAYRLVVGQRLDHVEGAAASTLQSAHPDDAMAWRTGRLVYRNEPLANVVADLNRYAPQPVRIADPKAARMPFSGVLVADDGAAAVRTLTLLAPITSTSSPEGILLRAR